MRRFASQALWALTLAVPAPALAQENALSEARTYRPHTSALRIDRAQAPVIDGDLTDPAWGSATVIDAFYQVEPTIGATPSEPTRLYLMYDEQNLYVGVHAFDSDPARIRASIMSRDGQVRLDDQVRIFLDPLDSGRNGYTFAMNPLGAREDAVITNNSQYVREWDAIWSGDARIVADGWTAEFAIPFANMPHARDVEAWGMQVLRVIRRHNEQIRWSAIDRAYSANDLSFIGRIEAPADIEAGRGLDVQTFATAAWRAESGKGQDVELEASGNAYYRITSSLTGTLTINTDFSDTPLDQRQVNTGRFSLFLPETRDFFLQDVSLFEFGGAALAIENDPNGSPFFSRRIGIVGGEEVDLLAGGKLSGRIQNLNLGALVVQTGDDGALAGQVLAAGRISAPIGRGGQIGAVFTTGDPTGVDDNHVVGGDVQFRSTSVFEGQVLQGEAYALMSSSGARGEDASFGFSLAYPNDALNWQVRAKQIGEDFFPALGFVNRAVIRRYDGSVRLRHRPDPGGLLRWREVGASGSLTTDLGDALESRDLRAWIGALGDGGDEVELGLREVVEDIDGPFTLPGGVVVTPGRYRDVVADVFFHSSTARPVALLGLVEIGGFLGGDMERYTAELSFRPAGFFTGQVGYTYQSLDLPGGAVVIRITELVGSVNFSPDMSVAFQLQHDNISDALGASARFRWEYAPGSELFVALGERGELVSSSYTSLTTQVAVRVGRTWRF